MTAEPAQDRGWSAPMPQSGPAIWLWPAASAALSAWPVWRSLSPEIPDLGEGWLRLEIAAALGNVLLYLAWLLKMRRNIADLWWPFWVLVAALPSVALAPAGGQDATADLAVLAISWTAPTAIYAAIVLLRGREAGLQNGCAAPPRAALLPPMLWLHVALGVLYLAAILPVGPLQMPPAAIGAISPGLILAWASLSDTARAVLSKRQASFSDASFFQQLSRRRRWLLRAPTILVSDRVRLVSLYPGADVKPGELVGLAAAATMEEESDIGRAIQEFGVSHRIRLPALRQAKDGQPTSPRRATLANGAVVELCAADDAPDLSPYAEAIGLARAQHRRVLALVERAPDPRVLGVIVFAIAARPGAQEALRVLRDRGIDVTMTAPPRDAADELALKALRLEGGSDGGNGDDATVILRGAPATDGECGLAVSFGGRPAKGAADIVVAREDARSLVDLARFADDFRTRTMVVTLLSSAPGWVLIASAFGYVPASPFLVTGVALIGIAIATVTPQVLRLSPVLDKEGAEE